jgi:outer membrane protein W
MKARTLVTVGLVVLLVAAGTLVSADDARKIRAGVLFNSPTGDFSEGGQTTEADSGTGFFAAVEFPITDRFGVEPRVGYVKHDITIEEAGFPDLDFGETEWLAITVNGNFHLTPDSSFDIYVGPTVGYVLWGSIDSNVFPDSISTDDEPVFGANAGIDFGVGEAWGVSLGVRYLIVDLTPSDGSDGIGVDPFQLTAGVYFAF